jgi:hypothetical protein
MLLSRVLSNIESSKEDSGVPRGTCTLKTEQRQQKYKKQGNRKAALLKTYERFQ